MTVEVERLGKWNTQDTARLVACLENLPLVNTSQDFMSTTAAEKLLDCVLSLHRRWDGFVVRRVKDFGKQCPNVQSLNDLAQCVTTFGGHEEFYKRVLHYDYADSAQMFDRVLNYLMVELGNHPGATETERLVHWARNAETSGYRSIWVDPSGGRANIPMFGIAGWQYLRMLFEADTCKPDIAVKGFVEECLGRSLSAVSVVGVIEDAAPRVPQLKYTGEPVREADRLIWNQYNNSNKTKRPKKSGCRSDLDTDHRP